MRKKTAEKVTAAGAAWAKAPAHIKAMAGAYVGPLIEAMSAINEELDQVHSIMCMGPEFFQEIGGDDGEG